MSEREYAFLKMLKRVNWTFLAVQIIVLIFYIGYTYARINKIDDVQIEAKNEMIDLRMSLDGKADKTTVTEMKADQKADMLEIRNDIRSIRNILMQQAKNN